MLTSEEIMKLCPKIDRLTVTPDGTVGMKVGEFSQAINVNVSKEHHELSSQIKDLYLDLMAMNRNMNAQYEAARRLNG